MMATDKGNVIEMSIATKELLNGDGSKYRIYFIFFPSFFPSLLKKISEKMSSKNTKNPWTELLLTWFD